VVAPTDAFGLIGQVLDGAFRVERCIGEGGFSIVYKGTHVGLGEPIAIKCLKLPAVLQSAIVESFVKRFRDESRLQYKLSQGNLHVVRSIASGTTMAPATSALVPFTVFEWLEGRSLAAEFTDRRERGMNGRSLDEVVRMLDSAIEAVAYAHAQGVVHRDLNPGNLFLANTPAGVRLKVLDFGVAKVMADSVLAMPTARTVGNIRMFAPAYGAPEQFDERVGAIGPWTDVYALALVTLEALSDRTVIEGEHVGEYAMKALDPNNRPTPRRLGIAVGDEVENAFARATTLNPSERARDAGAFWGLLKHAMQVDARSGRPSRVDLPKRQFSGGTLRLDERAPNTNTPIIELPPPYALPDLAARGGTLRVDALVGREVLTTAAKILESGRMTPMPPTPMPPTTPAPEPPAREESAHRYEPAPIPSPPKSRAPLIVAIVVLALLGAGGAIAWQASQAPRTPPVLPGPPAPSGAGAGTPP
jgi:eukaryotic-like serine/threonine-protein kinase